MGKEIEDSTPRANPGLGEVLDAFAAVLAYPSEGYAARAAACARALDEGWPEAGELVAAFAESAGRMQPWQAEELFTRTFDLNPVCSLEVGWHLYGETYERGAFLVRCREALRRHGVGEEGELPDHLSHLLPLLARLDGAEASAFAPQVVRAACVMDDGFKERDNPYGGVMRALRMTLVAVYGEPEPVAPPGGAISFGSPDPSSLRGEIP